MESGRNNFEMYMLVGFASAGQAIAHQKEMNLSNAYAPLMVSLNVAVPASRNEFNTFSASCSPLKWLYLLQMVAWILPEFMARNYEKYKNSIRSYYYARLLDWGTILMQYARAIGWSITAAVGFAFGIGIALKVFDMLSTDIDEWEEIKKGNLGVSLIFISLIVMVGSTGT